jgi:hypothetical protein
MDTALTTTIVSTSGAVITGVVGMFFTATQLGKRIDDISNQLGKRIDDLRVDVRDLRGELEAFRGEFYAFKDVVNGKLAALDTEIAKLMDRRNPQ